MGRGFGQGHPSHKNIKNNIGVNPSGRHQFMMGIASNENIHTNISMHIYIYVFKIYNYLQIYIYTHI